jgi:hypothetical protein
MWWRCVVRRFKFIDKVEYCLFVQHLFVSHHITQLMLAAELIDGLGFDLQRHLVAITV